MNILDENILEGQRQILQSWRIRIFQIGFDVGRKGITDENLIPFLLDHRHATFFTRDLDFYNRALCHSQYCLICLAVGQYEAAAFVRRLLRHSEFKTQAKRMGAVVRVSSAGLQVWRLHVEQEIFLEWSS